jgi:hypothetical protein
LISLPEEIIWIEDVGFEAFKAVVINVAMSWDMALCSLYGNRRFGGMYHLHLKGKRLANQEASAQHAEDGNIYRLRMSG